MTKKHILRAVALLLLCAVLLLTCSCAASRRARPNSRANKTVATAGELEIPYENLYYVAMTRIAELKRVYGEDALKDPARQAELKEFVWKNLLTVSDALIDLAREYDLYVDEGEIAENVQEDMEGIIANDFGGERSAYIDWLNEKYMTDNYLRTYLAVEEYLPQALVRRMLEQGVIDDSDDAAWAHLRGDDFIRVRQVLIETRNYESAEAALARAESLRAKVAAQTTDAKRNDEMLKAMAYSTDLDMTGQGRYFAKGEMNADYENVAFSLTPYSVSEVMTVDGGYCFIMRLPKDEAYMTENFQTMKEQSYYVVLNKMVAQHLSTMTVETTDFGDSLDLLDLPPVDADGGEAVFAISVTVSILAVAGLVACVVWYLMKHYKKNAPKSKKVKR